MYSVSFIPLALIAIHSVVINGISLAQFKHLQNTIEIMVRLKKTTTIASYLTVAYFFFNLNCVPSLLIKCICVLVSP